MNKELLYLYKEIPDLKITVENSEFKFEGNGMVYYGFGDPERDFVKAITFLMAPKVMEWQQPKK